jgi:hypothetical protein
MKRANTVNGAFTLHFTPKLEREMSIPVYRTGYSSHGLWLTEILTSTVLPPTAQLRACAAGGVRGYRLNGCGGYWLAGIGRRRWLFTGKTPAFIRLTDYDAQPLLGLGDERVRYALLVGPLVDLVLWHIVAV